VNNIFYTLYALTYKQNLIMKPYGESFIHNYLFLILFIFFLILYVGVYEYNVRVTYGFIVFTKYKYVFRYSCTTLYVHKPLRWLEGKRRV
jgi:hypothetical protein